MFDLSDDMQQKRLWLDGIGAGDFVILQMTNWPDRIVKVESVTTNFIIIGGEKYRRSNGSKCNPDKYVAQFITPLTQEKLIEIRFNKSKNILSSKFDSFLKTATILDLEKINSILKILEG